MCKVLEQKRIAQRLTDDFQFQSSVVHERLYNESRNLNKTTLEFIEIIKNGTTTFSPSSTYRK